MTASAHTLRGPVAFEGVGLHSGAPATMRIAPAAAGSGIAFRLPSGARCPALAEHVVDTRRATVLGIAGETVSTVEHVLSALAAAGVDDAEIAIDGPEVPIMDGSAAVFSAAIERAGLAPQPGARPAFTIAAPRFFGDGDAALAIAPSDRFRVRFAVDFAPPVGAQFIDVTVDARGYAGGIAAARTFGYLHEVEALRAAGLARGGSLENALVFAPDGPMTPLRWPNEVVRHKVLDLVGDFALLGAWPLLDVVAVKSGHRLHAIATAALRAEALSGARP